MQKVLNDIIRYTHDLGEIEAFKLVSKPDGKTTVKSSSKDMSVIFEGNIKEKLTDLVAERQNEEKTVTNFSRLNVLAGYLKSPVFNDEQSELKLKYREDGIPRELMFTSSMGHNCTYRMMSPEIARKRIVTHSLAVPIDNFEIIFEPSEQFVKDFQSFAGILSKFSSNFSFDVEDGMLYMNLGEDDTAKIPVVKTELEHVNTMNMWPIKQVLSILKQAPSLDSIKFHICDEDGIIDIHIDTDYATYSYKLPAAQ